VIPDLIPGQVVFVSGPVASGKTFLLGKWAEREKHVLLFDTAGDHIDNPAFEHIWGNPKALADRLAEDRESEDYRIAYHPASNVETAFDWAMEAIWQTDEPRWFIIEEVHELMSPWAQHPKMRVLNKYARKRDALGVIGSTQRIADVHKDFTSAARMSVLFHTNESTDLRAIGERYGDDVLSSLSTMRPLLYRDADGQVDQTPQAILARRGQGFEIIEVG
jgi:hypothetical protein